ncbi:MAG: hypothetical protein AAF348_19660, partial [Bacteroidota bacterium]
YVIQDFWDNQFLLELGKQQAPILDTKFLVFEPNYINNAVAECERNRPRGPRGLPLGPGCGPVRTGLENLRDEVIEEHIDNDFLSEEFLQQQEPDYYKQTVTNPRGQISRIHENAFTIENNRGQTIAFVTPDEKFFFWNESIEGGYSQNETSERYRDTYMYYVEDKYHRQSEPISWGIYRAADDLGGFILDLVGHPSETINDFAVGIQKIITLDFDLNKTWESILDADLSDVSYISATLALGHLAGPRGANLIAVNETGQFQQFLSRYAGKKRPTRLTWPEVLELFRRARDFENAVSQYLNTLYTTQSGFKTFSQVYLKVDGVVSIADDLIYNTNTRKWILNESKFGVHNTLSRNQQIIQDAIIAGKNIEIRSTGQLVPGVSQGSFIQFSEILRSHSVNGNIIFDTVKSIWKR